MSAVAYSVIDTCGRGRRSGVKGVFTLPAGVHKAAVRTTNRLLRRQAKADLNATVAAELASLGYSPEEIAFMCDQESFHIDNRQMHLNDGHPYDDDPVRFVDPDDEGEGLNLSFDDFALEMSLKPGETLEQVTASVGSLAEFFLRNEVRDTRLAKAFRVRDEDDGQFDD